MTKIVPTTQEQLIHFLLLNIQLGTYDKRFLGSVHDQIYRDKKPLTTNQAELFHKILMRYQRQLAKKELNSHDLIKLPWTTIPTESLPQFTQSYVSIDDSADMIVVHSPYKTAFVKEIKATEIAKWNKEVKEWTVTYCEQNLKKIIKLVTKHYDKVVLCDTTTQILSEIEKYSEEDYWNPTLVNSNGNLFIAASNEYLDAAIHELNNDVATIVKLQSYGIELGHGVIDTSHKYYDLIKSRSCHIDLVETNHLIEFLKDIKCDKVFIGDMFLGSTTLLSEFRSAIIDSGIACSELKHSKPSEFENCSYVLLKNVLITVQATDDILKKATKVIGITNNKIFK